MAKLIYIKILPAKIYAVLLPNTANKVTMNFKELIFNHYTHTKLINYKPSHLLFMFIILY